MQNDKSKFKNEFKRRIYNFALEVIKLLRDSSKADKDKTNKLLRETTEIANILASGIITLRGKR